MPVYIAGTLYITPVLGPAAIDSYTAEGSKPGVIYSVPNIYTGIYTTAFVRRVLLQRPEV
jgi:hypothetical protein